MKVIDILNKIENNEIKTDTILACNGFIHFLIVIDKELYFINTFNKELIAVSNKYIGESLKNNYNFEILNKENEILEEDKKIERFDLPHCINEGANTLESQIWNVHTNTCYIRDKINKIIDYLNKEK